MRRFLSLSLGLSLFLSVNGQAVSLSTWTYNNNKAKEAKSARETLYAYSYDYNESGVDGGEEADTEPETLIESYTLDEGEQVLRVKNGPNERQTITKKDAQGNVQEITKTLTSKSRPLDKTTQDIGALYGGSYHNYPRKEDKETQTDAVPLTPLNPATPVKPTPVEPPKKLKPPLTSTGTSTGP